MKTRCQSMVRELKTVLMKHPEKAYKNEASLKSQWSDLNYLEQPNMSKSIVDYNYFVNLVSEAGTTVEFLPESNKTGLDSLYTHDPAVVTNRGVILCNMGKDARGNEPGAVEDYCNQTCKIVVFYNRF